MHAKRKRAPAVGQSLGALEHDIDMLKQRVAEMRATLASSAIALEPPAKIESIEMQRLVARNQLLSERVAEAEYRLVELAESLIAATQAESARLALLIDTVQSSHFWRLKRWLGHVLHRGRN